MRYISLDSKADLGIFIDELVQASKAMIRRTGSHGQTAEGLIAQMLAFIGQDSCFLLVGINDIGVFQGFLFANLIPQTPPLVEVLALWTRGGVGSKVKEEVFEHLVKWGRSMGATRIITTVTRSPQRFYEFFHKPLGFKPVGWLLEVEI